MSNWNDDDRRYMAEALALARQGEGFVEPNPMVGCVLARGGRIVGRGWHRKFGGPHAEVFALRDAGRAARGATAFVTLEPCCHFGKTPPCADALIAAGVARVVAAVRDPNPRVAGGGFRALRAAGIRIESGLLRNEATALLRPFFRVMQDRRPYVILKWAQSIDGRIATRTGDSQWISSAKSRKAVHELRARVDAIVVGVGTVLADDPALTARGVRVRRVARRMVIDPNLRMPVRCQLVRTARVTPTWIVCGSASATSARGRRLAAAGCEINPQRLTARGLDVPGLLRELAGRGITNLLVEGGGRTLGAFVDAGLADEARVFVAPRLIGGRGAPAALDGVGPATMDQLPVCRVERIESFGPDLCYHLRLS